MNGMGHLSDGIEAPLSRIEVGRELKTSIAKKMRRMGLTQGRDSVRRCCRSLA